jgi:hypothetical protein
LETVITGLGSLAPRERLPPPPDGAADLGPSRAAPMPSPAVASAPCSPLARPLGPSPARPLGGLPPRLPRPWRRGPLAAPRRGSPDPGGAAPRPPAHGLRPPARGVLAPAVRLPGPLTRGPSAPCAQPSWPRCAAPARVPARLAWPWRGLVPPFTQRVPACAAPRAR